MTLFFGMSAAIQDLACCFILLTDIGWLIDTTCSVPRWYQSSDVCDSPLVLKIIGSFVLWADEIRANGFILVRK